MFSAQVAAAAQPIAVTRAEIADILSGRGDILWFLDSLALSKLTRDGTNSPNWEDSTNKINTWAALYGTGTVSQATGGSRPFLSSVNPVTKTIATKVCTLTGGIGGYAVPYFDGTDDQLLSTTMAATVNGMTMYVIARFLPDAANNMLAVGNNGTHGPCFGADSSGKFTMGINGPFEVQGSAGVMDDKAHVFTCVFNGASSAGYIDGVSACTGTCNTSTGSQRVAIGSHAGTFFLRGWVGCVLLCNAVHDATTRAAIESYLKQRYRMTEDIGDTLCVGDSMLEGSGDSGASLRYFLKRNLACQGVAINFVGPRVTNDWSTITNVYGGADLTADYQHGGVGGKTIEQLLYGDAPNPTYSMDAWMNTYRPANVIIHLGTNNYPPGGSWSAGDRRWLAFLYDEAVNMVYRHNPGAIVVLVCPPYDSGGTGVHRDEMAVAIASTASVWRGKGFDVRVADVRADAGLVAGDYADSTHLGPSGNAKSAMVIENVLRYGMP